MNRNRLRIAIDDGLYNVLLLLIYEHILIFHYKYATSVYYWYLNYDYSFSFANYFQVTLTVLMLVLWVNNLRKDRIVFFLAELLLVFSVIPMVTLFSFKDYPEKYYLYIVVFWILFYLLFFLISCQLQKKREYFQFEIEDFKSLAFILLVCGIVISIYLFYKYFNGTFNSILHTYSARTNFKNKSSAIDTYLINWAGVIFLPISFSIHAILKRYVFCFLSMTGSFLLFLSNGQKSWIFFYGFILLLLVFRKVGNAKKYVNALIICCIAALVITVFLFDCFKTTVLSNLVDRIFIAHAEIAYQYLEFFEDRKPLYLCESVLRHFIDSPYSQNVSKLIGDFYWGAAEYTNNTTGLLGDAYANFKIVGIILYPIMFSAIFAGLCRIVSSYPYDFAVCCMFIFMYEAQNLPFFTWVLTGGVLLGIILSVLMKGRLSRVRVSIK